MSAGLPQEQMGPGEGRCWSEPLRAGGGPAHLQPGLGSSISIISLVLARATATAVPGETQPGTCSTDKAELTEAQIF